MAYMWVGQLGSAPSTGSIQVKYVICNVEVTVRAVVAIIIGTLECRALLCMLAETLRNVRSA